MPRASSSAVMTRMPAVAVAAAVLAMARGAHADSCGAAGVMCTRRIWCGDNDAVGDAGQDSTHRYDGHDCFNWIPKDASTSCTECKNDGDECCQNVPLAPPTKAPTAAPDPGQSSTADDGDDGIPFWLIIVIIVLLVIAVCICIAVCRGTRKPKEDIVFDTPSGGIEQPPSAGDTTDNPTYDEPNFVGADQPQSQYDTVDAEEPTGFDN